MSEAHDAIGNGWQRTGGNPRGTRGRSTEIRRLIRPTLRRRSCTFCRVPPNYLPVGATARTKVASQSALSFTLEFDLLIHGWQKTRDSQLGGGDVPPTTTAPGFTVDGFTDISFPQLRGWALRASAKYQVTTRWSVEPYYVHWNVSASPVNDEVATFTVNHVTAQEQ